MAVSDVTAAAPAQVVPPKDPLLESLSKDLKATAGRVFSSLTPKGPDLAAILSQETDTRVPTAQQQAYRNALGIFATNSVVPKDPPPTFVGRHMGGFRPFLNAAGQLVQTLENTKKAILAMIIGTHPEILCSPEKLAEAEATAETLALAIHAGFALQHPDVVVKDGNTFSLDMNKANELIHSADDSGMFKADGTIDEEHFDENFDKFFDTFSHGKGYLTQADFAEMRRAHMKPGTTAAAAQGASFAEFLVFATLFGRDGGAEGPILDRAPVKGIYRGDFFPKSAARGEQVANDFAAAHPVEAKVTEDASWAAKRVGSGVEQVVDRLKKDGFTP